jgi:pre-rRNA-processing protein TSR4
MGSSHNYCVVFFFSGGIPEEELDSMAKHESKEDHIFQKFKSKIALEPEQVKWYLYFIVFSK